MIEAAKRDGSWHSLDALKEPRVPANAAARAADPAAEADFDAVTTSDRKRLLWWIENADRP